MYLFQFQYPAARVRLEAIAVKRLEKYKKAPLEKGKNQFFKSFFRFQKKNQIQIMEFCMLKTKDIKRSETYDMNLKEEEKFSHSYHEQHFIVHITIFYPETLTRKKMMFVRFFHESNKKNCHNIIKGPNHLLL